jgi:hypothetical protein
VPRPTAKGRSTKVKGKGKSSSVSATSTKRKRKFLSTSPDHDLPAELPPSPLVMASQSSKTADTAAPPPEVAATGEAAPGAASSTPAQNPNAAATAVAGATDLEKKMRRAERFGMPVLMSEEEKRSSRAERLVFCGSPFLGLRGFVLTNPKFMLRSVLFKHNM